jgi:glycosyltransferase involved in cell wall biosynthesis
VAEHGIGTVVLAKCDFEVRWPTLDLAMLRHRGRYLRIEHSFPTDLGALTPGKRLGGRIPGLGLWYWRHRGLHALHRAASDHVIAVSHAIRERLLTQYRYRPGDVTAIHNGVDCARFRPDREAAARARTRWGIPPTAFVVGTVTRLAPVKRLERLLSAFHLLVESGSEECYLVVVGDGTQDAALRAMAEQSGIAARCVWMGASQSPWMEYPGFDCFAMTSESEGLPYSLLEAMACECLPVAMALAGILEVVRDGETGRLVEPDVAALASALREVMVSGPGRRAEIAARARRHVLMHHDERRQIEAVCDLILGSDAGSAA